TRLLFSSIIEAIDPKPFPNRFIVPLEACRHRHQLSSMSSSTFEEEELFPRAGRRLCHLYKRPKRYNCASFSICKIWFMLNCTSSVLHLPPSGQSHPALIVIRMGNNQLVIH